VKAPRTSLFAATIFLSAFLLFQVQPIVARQLLPWFGGAPAVWAACLLFFQAALLAGYGYAHWLGSRGGRWNLLHAGVLAVSLAFLPLGIRGSAGASDPVAQIVILLAAAIGVPYFALSATAPLLQRWFRAHGSPWRFYALSNFGSFLALLTYPFLVEPFVRLSVQRRVWSGLFVVFAVLCGWISVTTRAEPELVVADAPARPAIWTVLFWLGLPAAASSLLVATTNQISQEIAANPFLWVAPLSLYLLSFVLTFESRMWYRRTAFAVAAGLLAAITCGVLGAAVVVPLRAQFVIYVVTLFAVCMLCHGEMVASRPDSRHLTAFYLCVAAGGAIGGTFAALIAPRVFKEFSEYPIALAAACLLGLAGWLREGGLKLWISRNIAVRVSLMALLLGAFTAIAEISVVGAQPTVSSSRNFYGILRITEQTDGNGPLRKLTHGRTYHGFEYLDPAKRDWPTMYYGPHSGAALALNALAGDHRRIAVIGLGAGTLALWGGPGDTVRFYEINPAVAGIARDWFSFLRDSRARTEIVLGDGRLELDRDPGMFDAIAVDAFSSDSIPVHLLTAECADIYRRHLRPGGVLLLHITNRVLNLEPVARGLAAHLGWPAELMVSGENPETGETLAQWVVISSDANFLAQEAIASEATGWSAGGRIPLTWTDDFSSLWHVLK
jgi:hypothetical protein